MLEALVTYYSPGGNTHKAAQSVAKGLERQGARVTLAAIDEMPDPDLMDYDLVCLGSPAYHFNVPEAVLRYTKRLLGAHSRRDLVRLQAPQRPQKWAVAFVTFGGPHTGIDEATPAGDHLSQFFRHMGFQVRGKWYTPGAFHREGAEENVHGFMGDIRGRPDEHDLAVLERNAYGLAHVLKHEKRAPDS